MRLRSARVVATLGGIALLSACSLSTGGLYELSREDGVEPMDGTASAEGSSSGDDTGTHRPDSAPDGRADAPSDFDGTSPTDSGDGSSSADGDAGGEPEAAADVGELSDADAGDAAQGDSAQNEGGDAQGVEAGDAGGTPDAGGPNDAGDGGGVHEAGPVGCPDASTACVVVPPGWTLVAFAPDQTASCPTGFGQSTNVVEGPNAASACGCGSCTVTTPPTCTSGSVQVFYDVAAGPDGGSCSTPGSVTPLGNNPAGSCGTDIYQGNYAAYDIEYVPPAPSGGACVAPGAPSGGLTYAAHNRSCAPNSAQAGGCSGNVCTPSLSGSYKPCITQPGVVSCPAGPLSQQHLVGTSASFSCTACGCGVTAQCAGTVTLYTDTNCRNGALQVPADSSCNSVSSLATGSTNIRSYMYTGSPKTVGCTASGTSTAQNVALANESTVCCAP